MSIEYEAGLLSSILVHGLDDFYDAFQVRECVSDDFRKVLLDFKNHFENYQKLPSFAVCKDLYGYDLSEEFGKEPPRFWLKMLEYGYFHEQLKVVMTETMEMGRQDPISAMTTANAKLRDLSLMVAQRDSVFENSFDYELHEDYLRDLIKLPPIPTFFKTYDSYLSGGFRPGEIAAIAARPGEGKTWVMLLSAIRAWQAKKKVLFITTEMSSQEIRARNISLILGFPIDHVANHVLSAHRNAYYDARKHWKNIGIDESYQILNEDNQAVEDVETRILLNKPDIVFIDGFYLLRTYKEEREKSIRIGNVINRLKRFARHNGIVVVVSTQMNRDGSGVKKAVKDLGRLSFTDEIGMICDHVIFISRDKFEKRANVMKFEFPKGRRLKNDLDIHLDFDLSNPRKSFYEIDRWSYEQKVKTAREEIEKSNSQSSGGSYEPLETQTSGFKGKGSFRRDGEKREPANAIDYDFY